MTNYRAILQYHYREKTTTQIAKLCECSRTTVAKTIKRAKECGIDSSALELMQDSELLETLYPKRARRDGYEKPVFDIYFSVIPNEIAYEELAPSERNAEVLAVTNETVKKSKYWAWKTLEYALFRSFGYKISQLGIIKEKNGKWSCKKCYFSISHSKNAVAVVVSNEETGIDIEESLSFYEKFDDAKKFETFSKKIVSKREKFPSDTAELIKLWTKKECVFKQSKARAFIPNQVCTINQDPLTFKATIGGKEFVGSVGGKDTAFCRFYGYDGQSATEFKDIERCLSQSRN